MRRVPADPRSAPLRPSGTLLAAATGPALAALGGMAFASALLLALALYVAWRSRAAKRLRPSKQSFAGGRASALSRPPLSHGEAIARLREGVLGDAVVLQDEGDALVLEVRRRRGWPCDRVAGGVAGLFEAAWAADVDVRHDACGGGGVLRRAPCVYHVRRVAISSGGRRAGEASTRGS